MKGAEAQVNYSEIRSPIDGVVHRQAFVRRRNRCNRRAAVTVMDASSLLAKTHIAQSLAQQMKVGDGANVSVPGVADPVPATVSLISPRSIQAARPSRSGSKSATNPVRSRSAPRSRSPSRDALSRRH